MPTITPSDALAGTILTDINTALNAGSAAGTVKFYTGTKPAKPNTAIATQILLGTLTLSDPAGNVSGRNLVFSPITQDSSADATGVATWARLADSNGVAVIDVDVSNVGGGAFLQMNTTSVVMNGPILISSMTITV